MMPTVHISEADAAGDFASLMARVREGSEVVIESEHTPVAILRPAETPRRTLSESIAILDALAKERGHELFMDDDFAADMREIVSKRKPRDRSSYESYDE